MKRILLILVITIHYLFGVAQETENLLDSRDGKSYKTVKIGDQIWMAENLSYKTDSGSWAYDNNRLNEAIYGRLYNWETAQSVCPAGWHLPSVAEWNQLAYILGRYTEAGGKLKATTHWKYPNVGATNETGFTALPGGRWHYAGFFEKGGSYGYWWSSSISESITDYAIGFVLMYDFSNADDTDRNKLDGFSVRCVKD